MENKLKTAALLFLLTLCPVITLQAQMNIEDMDEDDWMMQRDTTMLSRKNRTIGKDSPNNEMKYIVKDNYIPDNEKFSKLWYEHIYVGASLGVEKILTQDEYMKPMTFMPVATFSVGKEFTPIHSVRVALTGAGGYFKGTTDRYVRFGAKADYLYNLTNKLNGYKANRRLQLSLFGGFGGGGMNMLGQEHSYYLETHVGAQLKIFTGPFGSIVLEPYVGIANDNVDYDNGKNWRGFDWFAGLSAGYIFYSQDNLSNESRMEMLRHRLKGDRLIDRQSLESWRTPWFFQISMGAMKGNVKEGSSANGRGNITTFSIGRWMSPVIGMRIGIGTRVLQWDKQYGSTNTFAVANAHKFYGKIEALFNPLGFSHNFSWDARYGGYIFGGLELGKLKHHDFILWDKTTSYGCAGFNVGANFWYRLSKDLHVFIEPHFFKDYYVRQREGSVEVERASEANMAVELGLELLIRTKRYRDPAEYDDVQNYNYREIQGFSVGLAGGGSILQRKQVSYERSGFNFCGMLYGEYRFNHLHGIRLAEDVMKLSANNSAGESETSYFLISSLNYEVNLTNLLSGRFANRTFALEGFIGPALGTVVSGAKGDKSFAIGGDAGFKLSFPILNGLSFILQPTFYLLAGNVLPTTTNTVGIHETTHFYQDVTVGLQLDTRYFSKRVTSFIHKKEIKIDNKWKEDREDAIREYKEKQRRLMEQRRWERKKQEFNSSMQK